VHLRDHEALRAEVEFERVKVQDEGGAEAQGDRDERTKQGSLQRGEREHARKRERGY
jgi:hypothetical protein